MQDRNFAKMRRLCQYGLRYPDPNLSLSLSLSLSRGHNFAKSHTCLAEHNLSSFIDTNLIKTAIDRYSLDLSTQVL